MAARTCAMCKIAHPNDNVFDLVCFCDDNQGICCICFVNSGLDKKAIEEVRDYGWQILGKNHALRRRSPQSTDTEPMFESMMLQDPALQRNLENFFAGRPMDPSPYASYLSPALQVSLEEKKRREQEMKYIINALVLIGCCLLYVCYDMINK